MHSCPFSELFPYLLESKTSDVIFFYQTVALYYLGLETCDSYMGCIKHTYISMVKQTISTSQVVLRSFFLFGWWGTIKNSK